MTKRWLVTVVILGLVATSAISQAQPAPSILAAPTAEPVDRNATPEARALLHEIDALSGHYTLTGQHNFPNHLSRWSDRIYDLTGKYPALFGEDFGFAGGDDKDSTEGRPAMIEEVKRQYRNGAVIALCWHAVKPTEDEPVTFRDSVQGHLTDFEWNELLTPGTTLNARWMAQVDVIAGYLRQLQQAGVPILFRPYHEMNGNWFWWGGRPGPHGSAQIYRMIYDRFVNVHHLHNLVWVWNVNSPGGNAGELAAYDPGRAYADLYTIDIYGEFKQSYYDEMLTLAGDKPVALAEVGTMPTLAVIAQQPRWAYFMMWSGSAEGNPPDLLQANFHAPNLLTRGDPALAPFAPALPPRNAPEPVSPTANPEAKALLSELYGAENGAAGAALSGQQNAMPGGQPSSASAATEQVFAATGKYPAIYSADLGALDPETARAVVAEARRQHAAHAIVSLRWSAPLPTDTQSDAPERTLTAFEWNELMTPGTSLNTRWTTQVDAIAVLLKQLQDAHIAVLWDPYPEANGKQHWWAGRPGIHGSPALYRMLFDRLVNHNRLGNLVWVWSAAPAGFGPAPNGSYFDYYPGLLYTDALAVDLKQAQARGRTDSFLSTFGAGKVIGVVFTGAIPEPSFFSAQSKWAWFLLAPPSANPPDPAPALHTLYADPHIATRAAAIKP